MDVNYSTALAAGDGPAPGEVWLVGAGPGDPGLLTRRAASALARADLVLHDALPGRAMLRLVRAGATIVPVGKRKGNAPLPQPKINARLVAGALAGQRVVRLKGGDPFVFGRGGEETAALEAAGIPWEVVSGITSGIAAPAAAGIPVTHRSAGRGVAFVTGHTKEDAAVDWEALARSGLTLVIYMGIARCEDIVAGLRNGGLRADLPAAVIQHATLPQQRVVATTLARLPADIRAHGIGSPAILVIGEVANAARIARETLARQAAVA